MPNSVDMPTCTEPYSHKLFFTSNTPPEMDFYTMPLKKPYYYEESCVKQKECYGKIYCRENVEIFLS